MQIEISPDWALSVFLVALRIGALFMLSPVFTNLNGLVTVRVLLTLVLSALLVSGAGAPAPVADWSTGAIVQAAVGELMVGALMAFGVMAAFGAFSVAGQVIDIQSGLGLGSVYDPVTRAGAPLFAGLLNMLGVAVFFGMDAHHALLRGIVFSLAKVPPGAGLRSVSIDAVIAQFGLMFSLGIGLIIPVVLCVLLVEAGLAVMSRVMPQMNIIVVGAPVKAVSAFGLLALTIGVLGAPMAKLYGAIFTFWERILA